MKYLKIQNNGELDIRLVALMGGTTKANDKFKIGQFGTGLKYTLAFLYRNNLDFAIFSGETAVKIHTEKEIIRDEQFEIICINGQRTSITTKMGEDWQPWMIVRELWCNALDEGGAGRGETSELAGEAGATTFYVQIDQQINQVLKDWNKYFIHEQEPIFKNDNYAIYAPGDHLCLYKNGVLIHEAKHLKSVFRYDIATADINELREFKGSMAYEIACSLKNCDEKTARIFLENVTSSHFEGEGMEWEWYNRWGEAWKNVIGSAKVIYQKVLDDITARGSKPDLASLIIVPKEMYKSLTKQFEGIGAVTVASKIGEFYEAYDEEIENRIKQGLVILESCNYPMHPELTFVYGFFEDKTVEARINIKTRIIYISKSLIQQPLFTIVAMLIEENEHFNTGLEDETRKFQQHFINLYARQLLVSQAIEI